MSHFLTQRLAIAVTACLAAAPALAGPINLLTNGSFETVTQSPGKVSGTGVMGWTNNYYTGTSVGYNFLYFPNTADTSSSPLPLWGTNNGGLNALVNSPDGGNFIGMDGAYQQSALSQTLTGLTVGQQYYVSFYFAGAQQEGFSGVTTEQFAVSLLGGSTVLSPTASCSTSGVQCTAILTDQSHGFTGWYTAGFTFTASQATDTLSFLAIGTPGGEPPFSLLDGVSLAIPEPRATFTLLALGILFLARPSRRPVALAAG